MGFDLPDRFLMRQRSSSSYVIIQNEKLSLVEHFLAAGFQIDGKAMNHLLQNGKTISCCVACWHTTCQKVKLISLRYRRMCDRALDKIIHWHIKCHLTDRTRQLFRMIVRALAAGIASA